MSRATIHTAIQNLVASMTVLNGYNFDWTLRRGGGAPLPVRMPKATVSIRIGDEENIDDGGALGTCEYIDKAIVEMIYEAPFKVANVNCQDVPYQSDLSYSLALDDLKHKFNGFKPSGLQNVGVISFLYKGNVTEAVEEGEKYITQKATARWELIYKTNRSL